jgi:hypothetical protein
MLASALHKIENLLDDRAIERGVAREDAAVACDL